MDDTFASREHARTSAKGDPIDPFDERTEAACRFEATLLGADIEFLGDDERLLDLARAAYAGLPPHAFASERPRLQVWLRRSDPMGWDPGLARPPRLRHLGGAGCVGVAMDAGNVCLVMPELRRALVTLSPDLLRWPWHARVEMVESAVYQLCARVQGLHALHAAAVAHAGRGALLVGHSGAGKSTLSLHALRAGLDFITEDGAFLHPGSLALTGVASFLHVRTDGLDWMAGDDELLARLHASEVITRHSGASKHELDLRGGWAALAAAPAALQLLVFLSPEPAPAGASAWRRLASDEAAALLDATQTYARWRDGWSETAGRLQALPAFELRRGLHPRQAALELRERLAALP